MGIILLALYGYKRQHHPCTMAVRCNISATNRQFILINCFFILYYYLYHSNVSPSDSNVTLPRWKSTDRQQMAGDVTRLNVGVPRMATR